MRRDAKVDVNQKEITQALRKLGASVQPIHTVGKGCPDLLVGYHGVNYVFELKHGNRKCDRKLTADEKKWHEKWRGQVNVITEIYEALEIFQRETPNNGGNFE